MPSGVRSPPLRFWGRLERAVLEALVVAVIYIAVVLVVAWLLTVLIGLIPVPAPIGGVIPTVIWAVAAIVCLVILLRVVVGGLPSLP